MGMTSLVCRSCGATLQGADNLLDAARDKGWQIDGEGKACCKKCALLGEAPKDRLRPCPHCGRTKELFVSTTGVWYFVECYRCRMRGPKVYGGFLGDGAECQKAWNELPRKNKTEQVNLNADFFEKQENCDDVLCPIDGEKPASYEECAKRGWPCVACFRECARQETQEGESK